MDNTNADAPAPFTDEELGHAASAEQLVFLQGQVELLGQRCALLHANLLRAQTELAELKAKPARKAPADRKPPTKKS